MLGHGDAHGEERGQMTSLSLRHSQLCKQTQRADLKLESEEADFFRKRRFRFCFFFLNKRILDAFTTEGLSDGS